MSLNKLEQDLLEAGVNALCRIASALETIAKRTPPLNTCEIPMPGPERPPLDLAAITDRMQQETNPSGFALQPDDRPGGSGVPVDLRLDGRPIVNELEIAAARCVNRWLPMDEAVACCVRSLKIPSKDAEHFIIALSKNNEVRIITQEAGADRPWKRVYITIPKKP